MSVICLVFVCLIHYAYSVGSWAECTDLDKVKSDVASIESDICTLLQSSGDQLTETDSIQVLSAQCQLVAGMNYKVSMNIAAYTQVIVQYFIGLPINDTEPSPTSVQVIDLGYQCIHDVDEVDKVKYTIQSMEDDIRSLLSSEGLDIRNTTDIEVISAESQVYGGTTYKVTINTASYQHIILSYYVGFPFLIRGELQNNPTDLKLLDAGYQAVADVSQVEVEVQYMDADIRSLLLSNELSINNASNMEVISAVSRAEDGGTEYTVTLNIGAYNDVIISYDVGPPILIRDVPQNNPINLQLIDAGYTRIDDLIEVEYTVQEMSNDIRSLLLSNGLVINQDSGMVVVSAESQETLGTKYRVTINVASYTDVIISYYIGYPLLVEGSPINNPTDLQLIDAGSSRVIVGGYNDVSDLDTVKEDVESISDEIRELSAEKLIIDDNDAITVISAQSQVVQGMNYQVTMNIGSHANVIVKYFVGLPQNGVAQTPQNIELIDLGSDVATLYGDNMAGGYQDVDDLDEVRLDVDDIEDDIRQLLSDEGLSIEDDIVVVSAESQVVAGTNYRVTLHAGSRNGIIIQYFVGLPQDGVVQRPANIQLIEAGTVIYGDNVGSYQDVDDLQQVRSDVLGIEDKIRDLLNSEGLSVAHDDTIAVVYAESQVVDGTNYRVTLNIGSRRGIIIFYFIGLPVNDVEEMPQYLKLMDCGVVSNDVVYGDNLAGGFQDVDDLTQVKLDVARAEEEIVSLLTENGFDYMTEDEEVKVVSAQEQVVAGMNYRVTIDVGRYVDVVIQYFVDLPQNDPEQTPKNFVLIDRGGLMFENEVSTETIVTNYTVFGLIIVSVVLGLCLVGFMIGCVVCLTKNKGGSGGLYAKLTADGTDAIDVNL